MPSCRLMSGMFHHVRQTGAHMQACMCADACITIYIHTTLLAVLRQNTRNRQFNSNIRTLGPHCTTSPVSPVFSPTICR